MANTSAKRPANDADNSPVKLQVLSGTDSPSSQPVVETKAVNKSNSLERNNNISNHVYIRRITGLLEDENSTADIIGVCSERGKLRERTNRAGDKFIKRDLVLTDESGKVVVTLVGENAENLGNCRGYPVVGVGPCQRRNLRPELLRSESDAINLSPPWFLSQEQQQPGGGGGDSATTTPARRRPGGGADSTGGTPASSQGGGTARPSLVNALHVVADAGSSLVVDPLVPRTLELHQWFHKSLAVAEDTAEEMDTSGESILNRGSMLVSLTAAEDAYPMDSQPRGQALIINVMDFADEPGIRRGGSEKDADGLKELLEDYLDFQVAPRYNLGKREMLDELEEFARSNLHLLGSMAVIAIFSHGNWDEGSTEGYIVPHDYQRTGYVTIERILSIFNNHNCPNLIGKPKWFIFQCCRGHTRDYGVNVPSPEDDFATPRSRSEKDATAFTNPEAGEEVKTKVLPSYSDYLISHSTLPGYTSSRDKEKGSWFVQTMLEVFKEYFAQRNGQSKEREWELVKIMRKVSRRLQEKTLDNDEKQTCETRHFGLKEIYFGSPLNYNYLEEGVDEEQQTSKHDRSDVDISCQSCPW